MSYSDESYRRDPVRTGGGFFRPPPPPAPTTPPPASKPVTKRAAQVAPPVTVQIAKPKGRINLIFVMDVTSSMDRFRENIKDKMGYFCDELKNLLPELVGDMEIAFVGVGDHCDGRAMLQPTAFSSDVAILQRNLQSIADTHGGDTPEAYECLFKAANSWDIEGKDGPNCVLILVGDSVPHGAGYGDDSGCAAGVSWKEELTALKKKLKAFYFVSCADSAVMKRYQRQMADDPEHFIELGGNFTRLTNVVHAIIAKEVGEIDKYLADLALKRGAARATEVATLLKTRS